MDNKISFQDLIQKVRNLPKEDGMGYIGEFPIKATFNVWIDRDAEGKICHFTPHLNFYQSANGDEEDLSVYAILDTSEMEATPQDVAEFLEAFARQAGIDTTVPALEEDEAYGWLKRHRI